MAAIVSDSNSNSLRPCIFFDRDGVVNPSPGAAYYVRSVEEFEVDPEFFAAFAAVKKAGALAIVITSQRGVGKGELSQAELDRIHEKMQTELKEKTGHVFDDIYAFTETPDCPHLPKPEPEMILTAMEEHGIDPEKSWMVGDSDRDIKMGKNANLAGTVRIVTDQPVGVEADETFDSLEPLADFLAKKLMTGKSQ